MLISKVEIKKAFTVKNCGVFYHLPSVLHFMFNHVVLSHKTLQSDWSTFVEAKSFIVFLTEVDKRMAEVSHCIFGFFSTLRFSKSMYKKPLSETKIIC